MLSSDPTDPPPTRRPAWRAAVRGGLAALAACVGLEGYHILAGGNLHRVVPGRVYRSAQLSREQLEKLVRDRHVRTVVNLHGWSADADRADFDWYFAECRATHACGVSQEDVSLSAQRLPPPGELRRLIDVLDHTDYPILLHCKQGVDRTGLASAMVLLLATDADLPTARRQLSARYGHVPVNHTGHMDEFLDLYEAWLAGAGVEHAPAVFRHWVLNEYCPNGCRGALEPVGWPAGLRPTGPFALRLRAHNTSGAPWQLRPGTGAGVHVRHVLFDERGAVVQLGHAGLFRAEVPAGGVIDLTLAMPALRVPGRYTLLAELMAGPDASFGQLGGAEPLVWGFTVRE
jgi:hypothetical protein